MSYPKSIITLTLLSACASVLMLLLAAGCLSLNNSGSGRTARRVISLDGTWKIAEGGFDQVPAEFTRTVPVPGLVNMAEPAFVEPGPKVADRKAFLQKDPRRDAFWYRRSFRLDTVPAVATLKVHKAMFGTKVILNGRVLGQHKPCFTPGNFDAHSALKVGENELIIRVGADRNALGGVYPDGFDFEKDHYIPGIFDSVELICSGNPHILTVQTVPDIENKSVGAEILILNMGGKTNAYVSLTVREADSGIVVCKHALDPISMNYGSTVTLKLNLPVKNCRLWSPEDPFLYVLEVDSGADNFTTRFGMRTFRFDPESGKALLNGKPYYMRGSNITLYRFMEDPECGSLPWDPKWVRKLHRRVKDMHWNSLRYCIGFPPEFWYDIADEEGILIQDEFPLWYGGKGWSTWPKGLKSKQLAKEYSEWMRERWNHPCVVIWDANNETLSDQTGPAVEKVRGLDFSNRPWDNSYVPLSVPGDVLEEHPYHFGNPQFTLSQLAEAKHAPWGDKAKGKGVIVNEYGWLWLNRDGTPTTLTTNLYMNLLGPDSTTEQRRNLYAKYMAAETEFWRCHREAAAILHFTALGYSRPDGQTSDHWIDVKKLKWEPEFYRYVRDAFAPIGLMVDFYADKIDAGATRSIPVVVINDLDETWSGPVVLRVRSGKKCIFEMKQSCSVEQLGDARLTFDVKFPAQAGEYTVEAELTGLDGDPVRSVRDFKVERE